MEEIKKRYSQFVNELNKLYATLKQNQGDSGLEVLNRVLINKRLREIEVEINTLRDTELRTIKSGNLPTGLFQHCFNCETKIEVVESQTITEPQKTKGRTKKGA